VIVTVTLVQKLLSRIKMRYMKINCMPQKVCVRFIAYSAVKLALKIITCEKSDRLSDSLDKNDV